MKSAGLATSQRLWTELLYLVPPTSILLWFPGDIQTRLACLCGSLVLLGLLRDLREARGAPFPEGLHFGLEALMLAWTAAWTHFQMPVNSRVEPIFVWLGAIAFGAGLHTMRWLERRPGSGVAYFLGLSLLMLLVYSVWLALAITLLAVLVGRLRFGIGAKTPVSSQVGQTALGCGLGLVACVLAQGTRFEWVAIGLFGAFVFLLNAEQAEELLPLTVDRIDPSDRARTAKAADGFGLAMAGAAGFLMLVLTLLGMALEPNVFS